MNLRFSRLILILFITLFSSGFLQAQEEDTSYFTIEGEVLKPLKLSLENLHQMKNYEVKIQDIQGNPKTFKGVRLFDVLDSAGVSLGGDLRGENLTKSLLMTASDGYQVVFALAEIDPEFTDQVVLIAYEVDGEPLPMGEGPFRIIAPEDKRASRWIRELVSIKVLFPRD